MLNATQSLLLQHAIADQAVQFVSEPAQQDGAKPFCLSVGFMVLSRVT